MCFLLAGKRICVSIPLELFPNRVPGGWRFDNTPPSGREIRRRVEKVRDTRAPIDGVEFDIVEICANGFSQMKL
jgi:hypothetical protein